MDNKKNEFQRLLYEIAFCTIACDGTIDQKEINEMQKLNSSTPYFSGIDLTHELDNLVVTLKEKGKHIIDDLFDQLKNVELNAVEELLILELTFRLALANDVIDENEIKFANLVRSHLKITDNVIKDRFGDVKFLFKNSYSVNADSNVARSELIKSISMKRVEKLRKTDITTIDFNKESK